MESDQANQVAEVSSDAQNPESTSGGGETAQQQPTRSHADIARLEARLREKEQLVSALTERLEQAAEQLDRIHRSGGDRALRVGGGGGGLPPELVQQQTELVQQLKIAVDEWQETQAAATLARIELGISEIRDLLTSGNSGGGRGSSSGGMFQQTSAPRKEQPKPSSKEPDGNQPSPSSWEALKAGIFAAENGGAPAAQEPQRAEEPQFEPPPVAHDRPQIPAMDAPEPVDFESASIEELREAVEQRDRYIVNLTERLELADTFFGDTEGWKSLENAPEELRSRLETLETQLQDKLREAEVRLSVERAQMGREQAKLQQQREQIDKELKRLGLSAGGDDQPDDGSGSTHPDDDPQGSRWMRFLRKGE